MLALTFVKSRRQSWFATSSPMTAAYSLHLYDQHRLSDLGSSGIRTYTTGNGNVVSFDGSINDDSNTLLEFLQAQAAIPPSLTMRIKGTHANNSVKTRKIRRNSKSKSEEEVVTEEVTESSTVVDFDFHLDLGQYAVCKPEYWVLPESVAAYRGSSVMQVDTPQGRRPATAQERLAAKSLEVSGSRVPRPWQLAVMGQHLTSLEYWATDYCNCKASMKEFKFRKALYGWDLDVLKAAVTRAIYGTFYTGDISVTYQYGGEEVRVRPNTSINWARSYGILNALLYATMIYPIFKNYEHEWDVCGAAYTFGKWHHLSDTVLGESVYEYRSRRVREGQAFDAPSELRQTGEGLSELRKLRDGEWFALWEKPIQQACMHGFKSRFALVDPDDSINSAATRLDGYSKP